MPGKGMERPGVVGQGPHNGRESGSENSGAAMMPEVKETWSEASNVWAEVLKTRSKSLEKDWD